MAASTEPKPVATGYPAPSSSSTAYPFPPPPPSYYGTAAPPPPHQQPYYYNYYNGNPSYYNNNPSYYNNNNSSSSNRTLLRRLFFTMIAIFLVIGLATMIMWVVLRPRLPAFSVTSANISSFNLSSSNSILSSSTFDFNLSVRNPNKKMSIHYDSVDAAVFLGSALVSKTSLPPFSQDTGNSTLVPARLSSASRYLDADAAEGVLEGKANKDDSAVYINLRVFSWVRFKDGGWATRRHSLRVYCDDLKIGFPNTGATSGSLVGGRKQCLVHL